MSAPAALEAVRAAPVAFYIDSVSVRSAVALARRDLDDLAALCQPDPRGAPRFYKHPPGRVPRVRVAGRLRHRDHRVSLHPGPRGAALFPALAAYASRRPLVVSGVAFALDLIHQDDAEARLALGFLHDHLVLLRHGKDDVRRVEEEDAGGSTYFARRQRARVLALYGGYMASRKWGGAAASHIEMRVSGPARLRTLGINDADDLTTFDHARYWRRSVALEALDVDALAREVGGSRRAGWIRAAAHDTPTAQQAKDFIRERWPRLRRDRVFQRLPWIDAARKPFDCASSLPGLNPTHPTLPSAAFRTPPTTTFSHIPRSSRTS